jgi:hypothetical protein
VTIVLAMYLYAMLRWPGKVLGVTLALLGALIALDRLDLVVELALQAVGVYLQLLAEGTFDQLNLLASLPLLQTLILLVLLPRYRRFGPAERVEYQLAVASAAAFYALASFPVIAFRLHEMLMVFFLLVCSRWGRRSMLAMPLIALYIVVGLRTVFFGDGALLFPV